MATIGTITSGTTISTSPVNLGLVTSNSTSPPIRRRTLRSAWDRLALITAWITAVSLVSRDSTSPVRVTSKNPGDSVITRSYTAVRRSVTTRSPSHATR